MDRYIEFAIAVLGGGALSTMVTKYFDHRSSERERTSSTQDKKEEKAFKVLEGRIRHLETEMLELKVELKAERETNGKLKEENIRLTFENQELKKKLGIKQEISEENEESDDLC